MHEDCTVYLTIDLIAKRWSMLILLEIHRSGGSPVRFNAIKAGLKGITPKVLSQRLRELEEAGLIDKAVDRTKVPFSAEYSLTESGEELISVVKGFKEWALKWKVDNPACGGLDCSECGLRDT